MTRSSLHARFDPSRKFDRANLIDTLPDIYQLETVEQVRAIADELRQRIAAALTERAMTVTQVGDLLGVAPAKVHYHVRELERVRLVRLVETREKGGILEKYYRTVARDISVPTSLLQSLPSDESIATAAQIMEETGRGFMRAFGSAATQDDLANARVAFSRMHIWLTDDEFRELAVAIDDVLQPYRRRRDIPGEHERTFVNLMYDASAGTPSEDRSDANGATSSRRMPTLKIETGGGPKAQHIIVAGGVSYSREDLELRRERGEILDLTILGYLSFADDVPASLVDEVVGRFRHKGMLRAPARVRAVLERKKKEADSHQ